MRTSPTCRQYNHPAEVARRAAAKEKRKRTVSERDDADDTARRLAQVEAARRELAARHAAEQAQLEEQLRQLQARR